VHTKNPTQRRHYVIAKDRMAARPVIDTLLKNGLKKENVIFLTSPWNLHGQNPNEIAFIYVPGYTEHPEWVEIRVWVTAMVGLGAIVKPVPARRLIDELDELDKAVKVETNAYTLPSSRFVAERPAGPEVVNRSVEEPTGGLWDEIAKGHTKAQLQPRPDTEYKQFYLGGPLHARRRYADKDPRLTGLYQQHEHDYEMYTCSVLGANLTFWVHENDWYDRHRLAREFLLSSLEI